MNNLKIVVACDMDDIAVLRRVVEATCRHPSIAGYKIGTTLGLRHGLTAVVDVIRHYSDAHIIYDHQKGGNDISAMGGPFARTIWNAGITSAILFPFVGPISLFAWVGAMVDYGISPIIGAHMTHPGATDYLVPQVCESILDGACNLGVTSFVLPRNNPDVAGRIAGVIRGWLPDNEVTFYVPGITALRTDTQALRQVLGCANLIAIVGRTIVSSSDPVKAMDNLLM